jgi:hypothetical protein
MKWIKPFPRWTAVIIVLHYPAQSHNIITKQMLPTTILFNIVGLAFVSIVAILELNGDFFIRNNIKMAVEHKIDSSTYLPALVV